MSEKPSAGSSAGSVKTAARTLDVFEAFRDAGEPLSLSELADRINSPVSSCHALVKTLQARGYIYTLDQRRRMYPTKRLKEIAEDIAARDPLLSEIAPLMERLRDATGETVIMGKRQGGEVIYLDVVEGRHTIRYSARPGEAKPLHSSAIGKAFLGTAGAGEARKLLAQGLPAHTPNTITDPAALLADLEAGRARGWYVTRGENVVDVMAFAIAVEIAGETLGFALAGPIARMEAEQARYLAAVEELRSGIETLAGRLARIA